MARAWRGWWLPAGLALVAACDGQAPDPTPTDQPVAHLVGNLQADAPVIASFDPTNWVTTSNMATGLPPLGPGHEVLILFRRSGAGQWAWLAIEADSARGPARGLVGGTLTFDGDGRLTDVHRDAARDGVPRLPFTIDFGSTFPSGAGTDGLTQYHAPSFMEAH